MVVMCGYGGGFLVSFGYGRFSLLVDLRCLSICSSCGLFAFELLVCFLYCVATLTPSNPLLSNYVISPSSLIYFVMVNHVTYFLQNKFCCCAVLTGFGGVVVFLCTIL